MPKRREEERRMKGDHVEHEEKKRKTRERDRIFLKRAENRRE